MYLYHFSDELYEPDEFIPIGKFGKFIDQQDQIVQDFEKLMESKRLIEAPSKISRFNCLFLISKEYVDFSFKNRKFLYELIVPDGTLIEKHNYAVITHFIKMFQFGISDQLLVDEQLMHDYWSCPDEYRTWDGDKIDYEEELLVNEPLQINKIILNREITIREYVQADLPFYHVTKTKNLESIIENGLENRNGRGICVVRSKHPMIIKFLVEMMLLVDDDVDFSIIKITPSTHNIQWNEISNDLVVKATNPMHNYILRNTLYINSSEVEKFTYHYDFRAVGDIVVYEEELRAKGLIWKFK